METDPVDSGLKRCPKCGFEESAGSLECRRCGVIFSKLGQMAEPPENDSTPLDTRIASAEEWETETEAYTDTPTDTVIARYADDVPDLLQHTLWKMLAKDPDGRHQTAKALMIDLRRLGLDTMTESAATVASDLGFEKPKGIGSWMKHWRFWNN